jgi:5-methylcytosine-specific restriction endonuclease McrA
VSANAGRRGARWVRLKAEVRARRRACCLCGQPIDYSLQWPDPGSFSVQHLKSWDAHPELREDPANLDAAHLGCNTSAGKTPKPSLGGTSEAW